MLAKIRKTALRLRARWKASSNLHPSIRRYIRFCRQTWPPDYSQKGDSVVLVGLFLWHPTIHCYAHAVNFLARKTASSIRWFWFYQRPNYAYEKIFAAFGAQRGIDFDGLARFRGEAEKVGDEIYQGLRSKWDVINIKFDGIEIGDLIYDTYLRTAFRPTIRIDDALLREYIVMGFQIAFGVKDYLARHRVAGMIADHPLYIFCGIMVRLACVAGIPVHMLYYGRYFYINTLEIEGTGSVVPLIFPYYRYHELFCQLSSDEQRIAREKGRKMLDARLQGKIDGVLFDLSAYGQGSAEPILARTGRPRILVLLNDFFDAVHIFRRMLFPDFYEWVNFLLEKAADTPFDWYVKPHPNMLIWKRIGRPAQEEASRKVIEELIAKFPKAKFLDPETSNRQLFNEGVDAVFTVHGTVGHEFASLGVPVVNAGDNYHIAYPFNFHPRTVAEFESYVANAGSLKIDVDQDQISEFVYMNYIYFEDKRGTDANPLPVEYYDSDAFQDRNSRPETLDYFCRPMAAENKEKLDSYFDRSMTVATTPRPVSWKIADGIPEY